LKITSSAKGETMLDWFQKWFDTVVDNIFFWPCLHMLCLLLAVIFLIKTIRNVRDKKRAARCLLYSVLFITITLIANIRAAVKLKPWQEQRAIQKQELQEAQEQRKRNQKRYEPDE
tara:strand:- start:2098 stop:2445 length:348 start_codon:yes stop_codon:yes gene_type:complete